MTISYPTIRRGAIGTVVEELHQFLAAAGFPVQGDPAAVFGVATDETIRVLQRSRNLQVDGICGPDTWSALCTPVYRLGDRLLARRRPNLQGDDVLQLQRQLNAVGFDPGRIDGIFGPQTESALQSFQRDAGIPNDAICGPATLQTLARLSHLADGSIAALREKEFLAATPRAITGIRIFVASRPPLSRLALAVANKLEVASAISSADSSLIIDADAATRALDFDADLSILLQPFNDPTWRAAYYGSGQYHSFRGQAIATCCAQAFGSDQPSNVAIAALSTGFLRETRMPAVVLQLSTIELDDINTLATTILNGIRNGFESPPPVQGAFVTS